MHLTNDQLELLIDCLDSQRDMYIDTRSDLAKDYGEESQQVKEHDTLLAGMGELMRIANIELMTRSKP